MYKTTYQYAHPSTFHITNFFYNQQSRIIIADQGTLNAAWCKPRVVINKHAVTRDEGSSFCDHVTLSYHLPYIYSFLQAL